LSVTQAAAAKRAKERELRGYPVRPSPSRAQTIQSHQANVGQSCGRGCDATHLDAVAEEPIIPQLIGVTEEVLAFIDAAGDRSIVMKGKYYFIF